MTLYPTMFVQNEENAYSVMLSAKEYQLYCIAGVVSLP